MTRYPGPHYPTPPRAPSTPQNYPSMTQIQQGPNGPQNILLGPYNNGGHPHFYPQPYQQQPQQQGGGQPGSNCGTPSVASLQMV